MKILLVTQYFWPENFRVNDFAITLKDEGHEITVLTGIPNYPEGRFFKGYGFLNKRIEDFHGIKIIRVPLVPRGKGSSFRLILNYISYAITASWAAFFYSGKVDCVFVAQYSPITVALPAIIIKKIKKKPMVMWVQDLWPESISATGAIKDRILLDVIGKLVRYIYRQCDVLLVQSKGFIPRIMDQGVTFDRIKYMPNWAEAIYQPLPQEKSNVLSVLFPEGFRIMFAGNIGAAQDFETILSAAAILKEKSDIQWLIVGDGRMRSTVEKLVQEMGLTECVHFFGGYPLEDMPSFFAHADVMLVTLRADVIFGLTIPSKIQSYLACGKPIVAALDGEGARVIEESGAGIVGASGDACTLANNVLAMYKLSVKERANMGAKGRKYFEGNFERNRIIQKLNQWLAKLEERSL